MEPPVISGCEMKGEFFVLQIVFPHIDMVAVAGNIVERLVFDPDLLFGEPAADISCACQFLPDLGQVFLGKGDVKRGLDGLQIVDVLQGFFAQFGERFKGRFCLLYFAKYRWAFSCGVFVGSRGMETILFV